MEGVVREGVDLAVPEVAQVCEEGLVFWPLLGVVFAPFGDLLQGEVWVAVEEQVFVGLFCWGQGADLSVVHLQASFEQVQVFDDLRAEKGEDVGTTGEFEAGD